MNITAYVLAADPTWLRTSILSYYAHVHRIVVSYDTSGMGWAGRPIQVEECLEALHEIDTDGKMVYVGGTFHIPSLDPIACDTRQRQIALREAEKEADWVLQIDTDEVLPSFDVLQAALAEAEDRDLPAVEWPMQVLYRRLRRQRYLAVASQARTLHVEYPGPIAVKPGVTLADCRRTSGRYLRMCVHGDRTSPQIGGMPGPDETRLYRLTPADVIWHNSWARSPRAVRRKVMSWGHASGFRGELYLASYWYPSPVSWRLLRNLHPFAQGLWPRLQPAPELPFHLHERDEVNA
jgi:hypothetical protein